jgi:hypothetical protein
MNSHQRRKQFRRLSSTGEAPTLIPDWEALSKVPPSPTHYLEIEVEHCNGWIHAYSEPDRLGRYLSTHTFYGSNYRRSTRLLRSCGFNVRLANWDA